MTHARTEQGFDDGTRGAVRAPDLCRLTILAQNTQVDLALPADVPVALLIPGIVDMIRNHGRTNEFDAAQEQFEPSEWVLARVGQPPLSSTLSLGEHGIRDGELLMLESADATAPPPLFDDIMYNVAMADGDNYERWSPKSARLMGSIVAGIATLAGTFALLWSGAGADDVIGAVAALFIALLFLIAGAVVARVYRDSGTAQVLCGCALPAAFAAGVLFVPGDFGWAQILLGAAIAGSIAVLSLRVSGVGLVLFTAVAAIAVFAVPAAIVGMLTEHPVRAIGAVLAAAGLAGLAFSPRISMLLAKLPLPSVPAPGSSIDPIEENPDDPHSQPSFSALHEKATKAQQYMTGLIAATTLVVIGGALAATDPTHDGVYWQGLALAAICGAVLMFRGRTYATIEQAVILIAGGAIILIALLVGAAVAVDQPLVVFAAALLVALAALALGILAPQREFSPPLRRASELLEYAVVAAVIPLVCWVASLFELMRGL